jgi:hypothetical protein
VVPVYIRDEKMSLLRYLLSSSITDWMSKVIHPGIYAEYRYQPEGP